MKIAIFYALSVSSVVAADTAVSYSLLSGRNHGGELDAPIFDSSGARLEGSRYLAMIYGGSSPNSLAPVYDSFGSVLVPIPFGTGINAGYFVNPTGYIQSPAIAFGDGRSWVQVRAWDSTVGSSYEEAVARGGGGYGESKVFLALGISSEDNIGAPQLMYGLEPFSISAVVPEPQTWTLLGTGLAALGWQRWRRRR
jgi:hypothetical protein